MKSIVCEQPNQLKKVESKRPIPQAEEALIRIQRIGICGTDIHAYEGNQPFFTYPRVLGHELSGYIEFIPHNELGLKAGDQVSIIPYMECGKCIACRNGKTNCCTDMKVLGVHIEGGMSEWITVPYTHLVRAEGLTLDQAAMVEPLSIGAHAVRRAEIQQGEFVLVIGAGPIGLGVMAFAKDQGAKVIAMDVNNERLAFASEWAKVDYTLNVLNNPFDKLVELTNAEMPTIVFDATGNAKSMTEAFNYSAHGGKLIYVGLVKADISFNDPEFHKRELTLMGSRNATLEDFHYVVDTLKCNKVDLNRYITHRAQFDQLIEQFEDWLTPEANVIKAIVEI
ncbi:MULTISPECIES: zinc-binding alcohol dehydrogenase family protein [Priestia]|jgi:2-desacetyl-2-hydroxyethyl bacteriochlorophyllide A dehydrogenase|uniref:zinc-binding alcohol dehydrogenase family protein n=1 Tax=Priestia TaxID=2800373 RepID=UPI00203A527B|nr:MULTISPECIES: zinc-binding alcohol dehydrogenase family protein [Priestia]MCM3772512.1 zinc-binding alcohol dehydrogenase family protein [Priestia aryabhattai]MDY0939697.1 zinc-binding alcohol dehydrogenase family protein [Priestia megaterium]